MNTSTNENMRRQGGAFADGLTLVRFVMTPIIMFVIIKGGWPNIDMALLASILFAVAAVTDILDDVIGGKETSQHRALGWFDDIADTVLISGTLAAIVWSVYASGYMTWVLAVPALAIIFRDVLVGLVKGRDFRKNGWPETRLGTFKTTLCMLAVCLLVAAPWLSDWISRLLNPEALTENYYQTPIVGQIGLGLLWLAALLSVATGLKLLFGKSKAANDA